ncbi:hypothetical protein LJR255_001091 [Pararhizobium sp. LjRoot255]|uniref:hypothetical protein n=1 Tax=Pararhizobium sp. LjRoot255 TaxID=3342298 RepID=UPI003ECE26E7
MLLLKLTLVPAFLLAVSLAGKKWGPAIAGWLSALPVVAGPILYLLVLEHGPRFGSEAATLSVYAIAASEAYNFAYAWTCRSKGWVVSVIVALTVWCSAAFGLTMLPVSAPLALVCALAAVLFSQAFLPRSRCVATAKALGRGDILSRMLAGAALTVAVTSLASAAGSSWSGLLAVFPLLGIVLSASSHRAAGPEFVISLLRGMALGRFAFAAFCLVLVVWLPRGDANLVFAGAAVVSLTVHGLSKKLLNRGRITAQLAAESE